MPAGGKVVNRLYEEVCDLQEHVLAQKENSQTEVKNLALDCDITPEKLKHAMEAVPNIPKFSGYDAKLDLFMVKSQYQKHLQPMVQKNRWADYLKLSYMSGSALYLVAKEQHHDSMWE